MHLLREHAVIPEIVTHAQAIVVRRIDGHHTIWRSNMLALVSMPTSLATAVWVFSLTLSSSKATGAGSESALQHQLQTNYLTRGFDGTSHLCTNPPTSVG